MVIVFAFLFDPPCLTRERVPVSIPAKPPVGTVAPPFLPQKMLIGPVIYHPAKTIQTGFENILTWYLHNLAVYNVLSCSFEIKAAHTFVFSDVLSLVVVVVNVTVNVNNI